MSIAGIFLSLLLILQVWQHFATFENKCPVKGFYIYNVTGLVRWVERIENVYFISI